jgi:hypothetical protein
MEEHPIPLDGGRRQDHSVYGGLPHRHYEKKPLMSRQQDLFFALAEHLEALADTLRRFGKEDDPGPSAEDPDATPGAPVVSSLDPEEAVSKARGLHPLLGSHQELAIRQLASAHPQGLSASQINSNPNTQPNTYLTLDKLAELGVVRRDDSTHPRRYYLGPRMLG